MRFKLLDCWNWPEFARLASVTIPPGSHRLEIRYQGLSFMAPGKLRFRYRLDGLDKDWIDVGNRRAVYLPDLRPGHYRLLVMAANNDGVWNEPGLFAEITVQPNYYQTSWFIGSAVFKSAQAGTAILGSFVGVSDGVTYDGIIFATGHLEFYSISPEDGRPRP